MRRVIGIAGLMLTVGACTSTSQDRLRDYNEDGVHLYQTGAYANARDSFQAALTLNPQDPNLIFNLAQCHDRLGNSSRAEQLYKECLLRAPNHAECRHAYNVLLVETARRGDAILMVEDWLKREPTLSSPYVEDAWLRARDGDLMHARGRLQQALDYNPRDRYALVELARVYERLGRPDRAILLYERALEVDPHQPDITLQLTKLRASGVGRPRPD